MAPPKIRGKRSQIPTGKIKPNPWNPNELTPFMFDKLKASIIEYGFTKELVVRKVGKHFEIIDGEHRLQVAKELKMKDVPCLDLGTISDAEAKQLCEVFIHLHGEPDLVKEATLIRSLVKDDGVALEKLIEVLPFQEDQLKSLHDSLDFDWSQFSKPPANDPSNTGGEMSSSVTTGDISAPPSQTPSDAPSSFQISGLSDESLSLYRRAVELTGEADELAAFLVILHQYIGTFDPI